MVRVTLPGIELPVKRSATLLVRDSLHSVVPEFYQLLHGTHDPAERRDKAVRFLSATYYGSHRFFTGALAASYTPNSVTAGLLALHRRCVLTFEGFKQRFRLICHAERLASHDSRLVAARLHNALFNPSLHPETEFLLFSPNWCESRAEQG